MPTWRTVGRDPRALVATHTGKEEVSQAVMRGMCATRQLLAWLQPPSLPRPRQAPQALRARKPRFGWYCFAHVSLVAMAFVDTQVS